MLKYINHDKLWQAYLPWFVVAVFYLYQYLFRIYPNLLELDIKLHFNITAKSFGTLGALYLLAYALLHIPLGIIVDRVGVKKTVLTSIAICAVAAFLFTVSGHFFVAQISRFMMGAGSACAFMCALKTIADYFPVGRRGFLMGLTLTFGTMGPLFVGNVLLYLAHNNSWVYVIDFLGVIGCILFVFAFLIMKDKKPSDSQSRRAAHSFSVTIYNVWSIITDKNIIIYSILAIGLYTPLSALADTWGVSFLKQKFQLDGYTAGRISMLLFLGLGIGSMILPWISEKKGMITQAIVFCSFVLLLLFSVLIYLDFSSSLLVIIITAIGFFCGAEMMCFTGALQFSSRNNSGEIIGVVNTFNMLGGAIIQWLIGIILDWSWDGTIDDKGLRHYNSHGYMISLTSLVIMIAVCCSLTFFIRKKRINFK